MKKWMRVVMCVLVVIIFLVPISTVTNYCKAENSDGRNNEFSVPPGFFKITEVDAPATVVGNEKFNVTVTIEKNTLKDIINTFTVGLITTPDIFPYIPTGLAQNLLFLLYIELIYHIIGLILGKPILIPFLLSLLTVIPAFFTFMKPLLNSEYTVFVYYVSEESAPIALTSNQMIGRQTMKAKDIFDNKSKTLNISCYISTLTAQRGEIGVGMLYGTEEVRSSVSVYLWPLADPARYCVSWENIEVKSPISERQKIKITNFNIREDVILYRRENKSFNVSVTVKNNGIAPFNTTIKVDILESGSFVKMGPLFASRKPLGESNEITLNPNETVEIEIPCSLPPNLKGGTYDIVATSTTYILGMGPIPTSSMTQSIKLKLPLSMSAGDFISQFGPIIAVVLIIGLIFIGIYLWLRKRISPRVQKIMIISDKSEEEHHG